MTATARTTPMLRWSSVRDCGRKAIYEATGAPHRERSEREERILYRGQSLGREYANFLRGKYGDDAVQTELQIEWPLGVGHMDIYLVPTRSAIEVLSSAHASPEYIHSKLLQLVGYMEHATFPVDAGALVVLNPSDFTDEIFPVARTSAAYQELVLEMRERVAQVQAWAGLSDHPLPARVCAKPSESRSHFCLHAEHCFAGWEPPPLNLIEDADAVDLAQRFYDVKQRERGVKAELGTVESERKEIERRLLDIVPAGRHQVGHLELTRTPVNRGPSVDLKKAALAGFPVDTLADYMKPGASYSTWRVDRVAVEDFGDEAPF